MSDREAAVELEAGREAARPAEARRIGRRARSRRSARRRWRWPAVAGVALDVDERRAERARAASTTSGAAGGGPAAVRVETCRDRAEVAAAEPSTSSVSRPAMSNPALIAGRP